MTAVVSMGTGHGSRQLSAKRNHFDPTGSVVFRVEYLSEREMKGNLAMVYCAELVGIIILVLVLLAKVCEATRRNHLVSKLAVKKLAC